MINTSNSQFLTDFFGFFCLLERSTEHFLLSGMRRSLVSMALVKKIVCSCTLYYPYETIQALSSLLQLQSTEAFLNCGLVSARQSISSLCPTRNLQLSLQLRKVCTLHSLPLKLIIDSECRLPLTGSILSKARC